MMSPARHVDKCYRALVEGTLDGKDVEAFAAGMDLGDFTARPARLEILGPSLAEVTVAEGKFHQVKRMIAHIGSEVLFLRRVRMGGLTIPEGLAPGEYTELSAETLTRLLYAK